jgi:hypothetical protein
METESMGHRSRSTNEEVDGVESNESALVCGSLIVGVSRIFRSAACSSSVATENVGLSVPVLSDSALCNASNIWLMMFQ